MNARKVNTTARLIRDLVLVPGLVLTTGILNWKAVQDARDVDTLAVKNELNHDLSNNVSAVVAFAVMMAAAQMVQTFVGTHVWERLSIKERIGYGLLLLVAVGGFGFSGVQIILDNTKTLLFGKAVPATVGSIAAGLANNGAPYLANREREDYQELPDRTPAPTLG